MRNKVRFLVGATLASYALASSSTAVAQSAENSKEAPAAPQPTDAQIADIIVTGSNIRGVAPAGTNVVQLDHESIVKTGASGAMQVLAQVPQVSNAFNQDSALPANVGTARVIVRPDLRNLGLAAGGSSTLVLIDGHRAVPAGSLENSPDIDVIPAGALERVDVVPDGGSSVYGSDAVGGVINFITRRRFEGTSVTSHFGFAGSYYKAFDVNLTTGKVWGSGSAYISYFYLNQDPVLGRDLSYVRQVTPNSGSCAPGTVSVARAGVATNYALPNLAPGTMSQCDYTDNLSIFPGNKRHSVYGVFTQDLGGGIDLDVRGFYTKRTSVNYTDFNQDGSQFSIAPQTGTITPANPYYMPIAPDPGQQSVAFSYAGVFDNRGINDLDEYGGTSTLTAPLGGDWQVRVLANYGRSHVDVTSPAIDTNAQAAALAGTTIATALNPYDLGATNPAVLAGIYRSSASPTTQEMLNFRAIFDGTLMTLPGGAVRVAAGAEYARQTYSITQETLAASLAAPTSSQSAYGVRNVASLFGEVSVPIVGAENRFRGVHSLNLSLSGRYDHYSDFGGTFNPKLGVTYRPIEWISIRGNWGKSFNAPGLADSKGVASVGLVSVSPYLAASDPFFPNFFRPTIILAGSNRNLKPQTAQTWSVGIDLDPPVVPGLHLSATYYNIDMKDIIGVIPFSSPAVFSPPYAAYVIQNPTLAQSQAATAGLFLVGNYPSVAALYATSGTPYVLLDIRQNNLGELKQNGLDFNASYKQDTTFGSANAGFGGTYTLKRDLAAVAGQPFVDQLNTPGGSALSLSAWIGASVGNLTGSARLYHTHGYDLNPTLGTQTHVDSFNTVNLFFSYDFKGAGMFEDLSLTLNVNNVFNQSPPFYNGASGYGYTNGSTLGRFVQFGVSKKF